MIDDAIRRKLAAFPADIAVAFTELLCAIETLKRERDALRIEVTSLRRQVPATFDNGICLVCGVAHRDTGMPCPALRVTSSAGLSGQIPDAQVKP